MKRIRLDRWANQLQPPRNPRIAPSQQNCPYSLHTRSQPRPQLQQRHDQLQHPWQLQRRHAASKRKASSAAAVQVEDEQDIPETPLQPEPARQREPLNFPSPRKALHSSKLAALHARLSLPAKLPLQTLARCLVDPSVDPRPGYNNEPLAILGQDLLGYYTAEWLLCHYPRLPMPIVFAAQHAYVGAATLGAMRAEWGVETVAAPGPEVDPGLLQLTRAQPGNAMAEDEMTRVKDLPAAQKLGSSRRNDQSNYRRGISSRIVYDDQFGDLHTFHPPDTPPFPGAPISSPTTPTSDATSKPELPLTPSTTATTVESASANFIRALTGSLYLHAGTAAAKAFHTSHILSRHLPLHTLFHFAHPTRDLSRLCAREGFEPPVARLVSETGRLSRAPVFVVGVFSGEEKLGEAAGASLNEGRVKAAAAALRAWYLYSPAGEGVVVPSAVEGVGVGGRWRSLMVDPGEIVT